MWQRNIKDSMYFITKRLLDIVFSVFGLIILSPIFLLIAILIKLDSQGSVFFVQKRVGKDFKPFNFYKFRTMVMDAHTKGLSITAGNDPRITKVGKFLRKTKLDELPQLWNVFKGDISLVGPRPEVPRYVEHFKEAYTEILKVKPGITDYAAIEFRNEEDILKNYENPEDGYINEVLPKKIELYKKYLKEKGLLTDIKLMLLTIYKVIKG